jgi:hypothetical protein
MPRNDDQSLLEAANAEAVELAISRLIQALRDGAPRDGSELARKYAIAHTRAEELLAWIDCYIVRGRL